MTFTELELVLMLSTSVLLYLYLDLVRTFKEAKHRVTQLVSAVADKRVAIRRANDGTVDFVPLTRS